MTINYDAAKIVLTEERAKLVHQLGELGATETGDLRSDVQFGEGFADAGAATAERTELLGLVESLIGQVDAVDGALVKLDAGTYGLCSACGNEIGATRMDARPTSVLCVGCKTRRS